MSTGNVKRFYEALDKDEVLQEKIKKISKGFAEKQPDQAQMDLFYQSTLIPAAREAGFEFTLQDLKDYGAEMSRTSMGKLTEDELAAVSGGLTHCTCTSSGAGSGGQTQGPIGFP